MKNETLIKKNGARIKMRAQNRTKVMAAIVATGDNRFSFASHVHAARECADGGGGAAHRSAHRGGPLSRDRPRPSEPAVGRSKDPAISLSVPVQDPTLRL